MLVIFKSTATDSITMFGDSKQIGVPIAHAFGIPADDVRQHHRNGETMCCAVAFRQRICAGVRRAQHRVLDRDARQVRTEQHGAACRHVGRRSEHAFVIRLDQAPGFAREQVRHQRAFGRHE